MEEKKKVQRKPYFFMWIVIGIGVGALIGGGLFQNFAFGSGIGVGLGLLLGLWSENLFRKTNKKTKNSNEQ